MSGPQPSGETLLSVRDLRKHFAITGGVFSRVGSLEALQSAVLDEYDRRFSEEIFVPALAASRGGAIPSIDRRPRSRVSIPRP